MCNITYSSNLHTSLFKTRSSVKNLASAPNGSGETSVDDAAETASLCADVRGARDSAETSPFGSSVATSVSAALSVMVLLPMDGA